MLGISIYGIFQSRNNKSLKDFFLGGKNVSWISAMFSIVATETSVLTFVSIPGIAYRGDWTFLQLALGYIFGRILVSIFLLPLFFKYGVTSIYEILEKRFSVVIQRLASATFLITRILADSVRFLATAIIIQSITGWSITSSVLLICLVTLIYTISGGLKTVIKIDAFQFIVYLVSAVICITYLLISIDLNFSEVLYQLKANHKIKIFDFSSSFLNNPFMFFSAFVGGTMLSFASHGADYMMVQRVLATKDLTSAKKAMIGSGIFVFIQFFLFLFVGSLIYLISDCILIDKDREITYVIHNILPIGFKGFVVAGVLSAAMSTLSSSINALASTTIKDWLPKFDSLKKSKIIVFIWSIILTLIALLLNESNNALVIIGLKIASYTYGSLLSFFILSKFKNQFNTVNICLGYVVSILCVLYFMKYEIAWTFYILGSVCSFLSTVFILNLFSKYIIIRDTIFLSVIFLSIYAFIPSDSNEYKYSQIIDLNIKESCVEDKVWIGSDIAKKYPDYFRNIKDVGLIVNHTSDIVLVDKNLNQIQLDFIEGLNVKTIFTPEHGMVGNYQAGEKIKDDNSYNIPIVSLYGNKKTPNSIDIKDLDAVFFDIQDIGSRYYTYVSTMTNVMEVCALNNVPFYVLDRPNPISGKVEGPILDKEFSSFVGMHEIPTRHGMTIGEIALMINENNWLKDNLKSDLYVVKMNGWNRSMYFDDTNLEWISPSPNISNINSAILYSGFCLFEGTNISEGRGTMRPFEVIGSPWLNVEKIIEEINYKNLNGFEISKTTFIPSSIKEKSLHPKYLDKQCYGLQISILDRDKISPIELAINLIDVINKIHPEEFKFLSTQFIDNLYGSDSLRSYIMSHKKIDFLIKDYKEKEDDFRKNNSKFLLYK